MNKETTSHLRFRCGWLSRCSPNRTVVLIWEVCEIWYTVNPMSIKDLPISWLLCRQRSCRFKCRRFRWRSSRWRIGGVIITWSLCPTEFSTWTISIVFTVLFDLTIVSCLRGCEYELVEKAKRMDHAEYRLYILTSAQYAPQNEYRCIACSSLITGLFVGLFVGIRVGLVLPPNITS